MAHRILKILVLSDLPNHEKIWWMKYVIPYTESYPLKLFVKSMPDTDFPIISFKNIALALRIVFEYFWSYRKNDLIITFQGNTCTALIGIMMRFFGRVGHRHVVLQFHRKERDRSFSSRFKYRLLGFGLKRAERIVCSARGECTYYSKVLSLDKTKFMFIPLCIDPRILHLHTEDGAYILSAGKTLRDYETLLRAVEDLDLEVVLISDKASLLNKKFTPNVKDYYDIPYGEYIRLMAGAMFVVIPLQDRLISTGQSVAVAAMALGKAVIVTKTIGSEDYVLENITGVFFKPGDSMELKSKILEMVQDQEKRSRMGRNAREWAKKNFVIQKYLESLYSDLFAGKETVG